MGTTSNDFLGNERFKIRRRLGSGGMGVVYEAHDRETDKVVALKALTRTEAAHISRFKKEFRSLADVSHQNLVSLYEFKADGQFWFFTMELVRGVDFLEYVRPGFRSRHSQSSVTPTLLKSSQQEPQIDTVNDAKTQQLDFGTATSLESSPAESSADTLANTPLDLARLTHAVRQLAEGLQALHETGKLHRDIKPSNVLVTKAGRVVILDFGLVAELEGKDQHDTVNLAGTPDYMSPEQGAQLPISNASDWYSLGVMLYQALTGRLPFTGKFFEVMINKQRFDPPAPSELASDIPSELNDLTVRLLRRNAEERPSGKEVLRILGHDKSGPLMPLTSSLATSSFVGRTRQLQELQQALMSTREENTVTVHVHGSSGMGKSALVQRFLQAAGEQSDVVILEGRCYERESVPYKALDGVIDSLTKYLLSLPDGKAEALMPRDVLALARLFPVMLQVDSVLNAPQREHQILDPVTLRRRAFAALRELLGRISDRQSLLIYIDDLQWADADSVMLLDDLLRPPESPQLLLLTSFRSEDVESKPFLKSLLEAASSESCRQLAVVALTRDEAHQLVRSLCGPNAPAVEPFIDSIVREASGSPFLIEQLVQYAATSDRRGTTGISLAVMLEERLSHLPKGSRQFVEVLAVAGRPINPEVAFQAARLSGDALPLVAALRAAQFLRGGASEHSLELYHDRIRETLAARLGKDKVIQIHRGLAQSIEARGIDDPEALFEHYLGAGERVRAAIHAAAAAGRAAAALAFDRAVAFYRRAVELSPVRGTELIELKQGLAEALVNAGRPADAAQAYLELAEETSGANRLDFKRRAAEQLLMGGHIKEGLEGIRSLLVAAGFSLPAGPKRALLSLLLKRIEIRLRGLNFSEVDASQISQSDLFRIDICWAIAAGLGAVDLIRGADFQCRHLLLALRAGEPYRVARAMAFEAVQTATRGGATRKRARQIAQRAEELAHKAGHPHAIGLSIWASGLSAYLVGHWKKSAELCEQAVEVLRDRCTGVTWELTIAHRFMLSALVYLGELAEVSRRVPVFLASALEQGNVFAATDLRTRLNVIWLAANDPTRARAEVIEALEAWPHERFHLQHYSSLLALAQIELYTGDAEVAWQHIQAQWQALEASMLLRNQMLRIEVTHLQARAALATASRRRERLQIAEKMARRIAREHMPWADALVSLILAGIAHHRNEPERVASLLADAAERFELADMQLYRAATRRRLGEAFGGERGQRILSEADAWMRSQRIQDPQAMTRVLAPGF